MSAVQSHAPIVMVDDNETDRFIASRIYSKLGLDNPFVTLNSGAELLAHLEETKQSEGVLPAVVLLDINMPEMNGFEVLQNLRSQPDFVEIPVVVMLTNSDRIADRDRALSLGANGYQTKPAEVADYETFFRSLLPA